MNNVYLALKACLVAFQRASKSFGIIAEAEGNERPLKVRNPMAQIKGVITESMSLPSATAATHQLHFAKSMLKNEVISQSESRIICAAPAEFSNRAPNVMTAMFVVS